jgi:hypothetical protein
MLWTLNSNDKVQVPVLNMHGSGTACPAVRDALFVAEASDISSCR